MVAEINEASKVHCCKSIIQREFWTWSSFFVVFFGNFVRSHSSVKNVSQTRVEHGNAAFSFLLLPCLSSASSFSLYCLLSQRRISGLSVFCTSILTRARVRFLVSPYVKPGNTMIRISSLVVCAVVLNERKFSWQSNYRIHRRYHVGQQQLLLSQDHKSSNYSKWWRVLLWRSPDVSGADWFLLYEQ